MAPLFLRENCCTHLLPLLYYSLLFIHALVHMHQFGANNISNNSLSSLLYSHGSGAHLKTERSVLFIMTVWVCKAGWQWHLALWHRCLYLDSLLTAKRLWQQHPPALMAQTHWETDDIFSRSFECVAKEEIVYTKIIRSIGLITVVRVSHCCERKSCSWLSILIPLCFICWQAAVSSAHATNVYQVIPVSSYFGTMLWTTVSTR